MLHLNLVDYHWFERWFFAKAVAACEVENQVDTVKPFPDVVRSG